MHWSEEIASKVIARNPNKEEYVCAAGISPSGSIHIGNFRDVATSYFVVQALRKMGKKARFLFSWDEFDRLRKIPVNVSKVDAGMEKYLGYPYIDVPNPFKDTKSKYSHAKTYAEYFELEFEDAISKFGIDMDYRYQANMYRSGKYVEYIIHSLRHRFEIFDILDSHRTQDASEGEREGYYPVSIYCPVCCKDTTTISDLSIDCTKANFKCQCGHEGTFDFTKDFNCKLAWKVDWPMRWVYEEVDFEPGGKDHASINGSYDTSKDICRKIFKVEPPIFQGYEFIGIRGTTGKMSGSSGLNLTPNTLLKIYQPEVLLWLYSKTEPTKAFDFCFDEGILRQYFEFDKMYESYILGAKEEYINEIMQYTFVPGRKIDLLPMSLLVQLGSVVDFNPEVLEVVFDKIGMPYKYEQFKDRLERAKYWLYECSPENMNKLRKVRNWDVYNELTEEEKLEIKNLFEYLSLGNYTLDDLQTYLYAIPKKVRNIDGESKELKAIQASFFKNVYKLLIGTEKGPRLYLFLYAIDSKEYLRLLDFSYPKTNDEEVVEITPEVVEEVIKKEADPVEPIKDEIMIDDFEKLDLRVCKIVKCSEIRKSAHCLKIVVDDGIKQRTIVSSIKNEYQPEQLIGKKIIVVANLKPARIAGVESEGMLLAGTNGACGCRVVFVDEVIPIGTKIK